MLVILLSAFAPAFTLLIFYHISDFSFLQAMAIFRKALDSGDPPAAVKWSFEDYGPETHALVTQFNGKGDGDRLGGGGMVNCLGPSSLHELALPTPLQ
ncbi:hypothetical protein AK812_SmicGene41817 [Symbiodinium microadriaticum]|uniref:Uncharacterized protein n=1 Tax=Symbiodinium microadriaticum TaxID=2951 RepID=A0A1Q9C568_SYMMI|nr:hypothetical protein AK812_SmicGene41817 [Symbiodinium microadriaticum]CAE7658658.1 unnamed protein product [Symbiodinium sp. KB8]